MKKLNYFLALLFVFCFCLNKSFGQQQLAGCNPPTAVATLDISNVRALLLAGGDMWWATGSSNGQYEVPKGSGKKSIFAGALWIGGIDQGGNIRVAAQTYRQSGNDFWPGPVDTTTTSIDPYNCSKYDRLWKINRQEVVDFIGGSAATADIISYPGNGDPFYNQSRFLAPFFDNNADGNYDTNDGDYPNFDYLGSITGCESCNTLHGDQAIWWVINDVGNVHTETKSPYPIGLEIQCQAFAYASADNDINNATFYQYKMINRNITTQLDSVYFGLWVDADLGWYLDDYIGCDVRRGMGYCYNGDGNDEGAAGYGINPPAIGIDFIQGPTADVGDGKDNDRDSCIDCTYIRDSSGTIVGTVPDNVLPEHIQMSKFVYYNNNSSNINGNPGNYQDYYRYLRGIWRNDQRMTYGGNGANGGPGFTFDTCDFMFPGDSDPYNWGTNGKPEALLWTEVTAGNVPDDRRFVMSAGPFTMLPGAVHCIKMAVPWARDSAGPSSSLAKLQLVDDKIQRLANNCFNIASFTGIQSTIKPVASVFPNPVNDILVIRMNQYYKDASISIYDVTGKVVMTQHQSADAFSISCKNFSSGIYFYRVNLKNDEGVSGKFVKE